MTGHITSTDVWVRHIESSGRLGAFLVLCPTRKTGFLRSPEGPLLRPGELGIFVVNEDDDRL